MVMGALTYREYTDNAGSKRQIAEIKVNDILVLKSSSTNTDVAHEDAEEYS